jgi:GxxExxY protein
MSEVLFKDESYRIIGACFAVYNEKGCGFLEPVYQECLEIELEYQGIPFRAQEEIPIEYRGKTLRQHYRSDIVCFEKILVEAKAVSNLLDKHRAQVLNYLNATKLPLGLLVNFGHYPGLEWERIVLTERRKRPANDANDANKA